MKITEPITVDLLQFFKTGRFDCLKLGQTKEWILCNFPEPDEVYPNNYESPIWYYGRIELHFYDNDQLFLIYTDHIDTLTAGENIKFNKWIFGEPEKSTLAYVIHHLNKERISFKLSHGTLPQGFVTTAIVLSDSNVTLGFAPDEIEDDINEFLSRCKYEDSNGFKLTSFSLSNNE